MYIKFSGDNHKVDVPTHIQTGDVKDSQLK